MVHNWIFVRHSIMPLLLRLYILGIHPPIFHPFFNIHHDPPFASSNNVFFPQMHQTVRRCRPSVCWSDLETYALTPLCPASLLPRKVCKRHRLSRTCVLSLVPINFLSADSCQTSLSYLPSLAFLEDAGVSILILSIMISDKNHTLAHRCILPRKPC